MKQYELCSKNNNKNKNNNNNNNYKKKEDRGEVITDMRERCVRVERELFLFFSLFVSFSDLQKSDRRFSSGLKAKLIFAMRATRGHQKVGVSTNSVR